MPTHIALLPMLETFQKPAVPVDREQDFWQRYDMLFRVERAEQFVVVCLSGRRGYRELSVFQYFKMWILLRMGVRFLVMFIKGLIQGR